MLAWEFPNNNITFTMIHCLSITQKTYFAELKGERERSKEAIQAAVEQERARSKVQLMVHYKYALRVCMLHSVYTPALSMHNSYYSIKHV